MGLKPTIGSYKKLIGVDWLDKHWSPMLESYDSYDQIMIEYFLSVYQIVNNISYCK